MSDAMFEVWINKHEPDVRLVVGKGSALPADLGARDWTLAGPFDATPTLAKEIGQRGFAFVRSEEPPPDPGRLKNDGAASS